MFLILLYVSGLQVACLITLIFILMRGGVSRISQVEQPNPETVKVMVHYENGEAHLKDGVIVQGNMWKALAGKGKAYVQANGNKYLIDKKSSFKDNKFHVMEKAKVQTAPQEPQLTKQVLAISPEEAKEIYEKWKDLPPSEVRKLYLDYMKDHAEVKHSDK